MRRGIDPGRFGAVRFDPFAARHRPTDRLELYSARRAGEVRHLAVERASGR